MTISPVIVVTHASFDANRRDSMRRLRSQLLETGLPFLVVEDEARKGSLWCWREAMRRGFETGRSHVVWLPDDAIICRDFGELLRAAIACRPDDVFDCYVNHPQVETVGTPWYSTPDGYVGMGGVMPRALLEEHLRWRDARPELDAAEYPNDAGVNLWAAMTDRPIYKTAWTLVRHDDRLPSLDGHDGQKAEGHERVGARWIDDFRAGILEDAGNVIGRTFRPDDEGRKCTHLGRTYKANVFDAVRVLRPEHWNVPAMYRACRPWIEEYRRAPHVMIVTPLYGEPAGVLVHTDPGRHAVMQDLEAHGVQASLVYHPGESLVSRMRQRAVHAFLKSDATHLLFWDADIECLTPECVRGMIASGNLIVAGACPFKNLSGQVVCNLRADVLAKMQTEQTLDVVRGCIPMRDVGSGFMLIDRAALEGMMQEYPDRLHLSQSPGDYGEPLWALFDTGIVDGVYLSEDYMFCRLWQQLGWDVYCYVGAAFRHWGLHGFEGSFAEQWGLSA